LGRILAALTLVAVLSVPTPGSARADGWDRSVATALARIDHGTWTGADLALVRSRPEVAASVPDPEAAPEAARSSSNAAVAGALTTWVNVSYRQRSLLGTTIYRWHHYVEFRRTGTAVTGWITRYDFLTDTDFVIEMNALEVDRAGATGGASSWSHMQRHLQYCILKYGCYSNNHPWSRIVVRGDDSYSYSGAAA
jgi:hypothetical protein